MCNFSYECGAFSIKTRKSTVFSSDSATSTKTFATFATLNQKQLCCANGNCTRFNQMCTTDAATTKLDTKVDIIPQATDRLTRRSKPVMHP